MLIPTFPARSLIRMLAASLVAAAAGAQPEPARPASLREVWTVTAESSLFVAPRSIVVSGAACTLWVTDPGSGLWRLPCDGGVPAQIGRAGEGPGEFAWAWFATPLRGDTIAVWDRRLQRLSVFVASGTFVYSRLLRVPEALHGRIIGLAPGAMPGTLLALTTKYPSVGERKDERSYVLALRADGSVRDSLVAMPGSQSVTYETGGTFGRFDAPLQRRPFAGFFRDGGFFVGNNEHARVDVYDASGRRQRTVSLPLPPPGRVTKSDRDAWADSIKRSSEREMETLHYDDSLRARFRADIERMLREGVTFPAFRQQFDQLVLDEREDAVWVLLPGGGRSYARTWLRCSLAEPSMCWSLAVPHQGAVVAVAFRAGAMYAIEQSLDGIPRVAKYASQ